MVSITSLTQEKIKELILFYGTQKKLASKIGVNQSQISRYLKGTRNPKKLIIKSIHKKYSYKKIVDKKLKKIISKPFHKLISGVKNDGRKFVRFEFPLWRRDISDSTKFIILFKKFRLLYNSVKNKNKKIKTQRLGISISTKSRNIFNKKYFSLKAKRNYSRKKEELDFITTIIYARNKLSTDSMFNDLFIKLNKYIMKNLKSSSLHEDEEDREVKTFYVFFEDESVNY